MAVPRNLEFNLTPEQVKKKMSHPNNPYGKKPMNVDGR